MLIQLAAENFRNLHDLHWTPGPGSHLLLGDNGAGKTSVIEAVYVIATTRSFRTSQVADCVGHRSSESPGQDREDAGAPAFRLSAEVEDERRVSLALGWGGGSGWRTLNGGASTLSEYLECLAVVPWSASDGELFQGSPEVRRRFLDRGTVSTRSSALSTLARYRHVLRQKREVLWRRQEGLASWNELLAAVAYELVALRAQYVQDLSRALDVVMAESELSLPPVRLAYEPSPPSSLEGVDSLAAALDAAKEAEWTRSRPLLGPHRDRLRILWGDQDLHRVASAGERKAVGLLLVAAQARVLRQVSRRPVLLLDDADSELDRRAVSRLWGVLGREEQIFVTSNRPAVWKGLDMGRRWQMAEGALGDQVPGFDSSG